MTGDQIAQLLSDPRFKGAPFTWEITPEGYDTIRRAWLTNVQADKSCSSHSPKNCSRRRSRSWLSVFTSDCVMELPFSQSATDTAFLSEEKRPAGANDTAADDDHTNLPEDRMW